MEREFDSTLAVQTARFWIGIFSWICIIVGIITTLVNLFDSLVIVGIVILASGISGLLLKKVLLGFHAIVKASEEYLHQRAEDIGEKKAE